MPPRLLRPNLRAGAAPNISARPVASMLSTARSSHATCSPWLGHSAFPTACCVRVRHPPGPQAHMPTQQDTHVARTLHAECSPCLSHVAWAWPSMCLLRAARSPHVMCGSTCTCPRARVSTSQGTTFPRYRTTPHATSRHRAAARGTAPHHMLLHVRHRTAPHGPSLRNTVCQCMPIQCYSMHPATHIGWCIRQHQSSGAPSGARRAACAKRHVPTGMRRAMC